MVGDTVVDDLVSCLCPFGSYSLAIFLSISFSNSRSNGVVLYVFQRLVYMSDSRVTYTPRPSPCPRSSLTHAVRSSGLLRNQTPGLVPVPARSFGYSVSDSRVACAPSPLPSPLNFPLPSTLGVRGFNLLDLSLFVFHNTDTFYLSPP